jgi:EmrB/QacA subfamily drug resistance transporter
MPSLSSQPVANASTAVSPRIARWVLVASIVGSSMAFVDVTVVNLALPALQNALGATVSDVQWVVESYALFLAALLLVGGSMGDLYGRRKIYIIGVVLFAAGSAWCGFSPTVKMLIAARVLQGIGGALLVPGALALISASYPEETRGRAIGTWSGSTAATAAIGPVIGGWLVEHASWRWAFFINLPLAVVVLIICACFVPESRNEKGPRHLDWIGAALGTVGLGAVTYALIEAPNASAHKLRIVVISVLGLASLAWFITAEARSPTPMVDLKLFRSRQFTAANLITLFLYTALSGMLFFYPLDLIQIQGYTATQAGAALLPLILLMVLLSRWSGGLVARHGPRLPLTVGPAITAAGFAVAVIPSIGGSYWTTFFPAIALIGLGMSISVAPLTTTVMNALPESVAGTASGINNSVSRVAGLLSVAVLGLLLVVVFNHALDLRLAPLHLSAAAMQVVEAQRPRLAAAHVPDPAIQHAIELSFVTGYRWVLLAGSAIALAASASAWFLLGGRKRDEPAMPA